MLRNVFAIICNQYRPNYPGWPDVALAAAWLCGLFVVLHTPHIIEGAMMSPKHRARGFSFEKYIKEMIAVGGFLVKLLASCCTNLFHCRRLVSVRLLWRTQLASGPTFLQHSRRLVILVLVVFRFFFIKFHVLFASGGVLP